MTAQRSIEKSYRKFSVKEQPNDSVYWRRQSYEVRLAVLEQIRCDYHNWKYDAEPRFQRDYSIAKRK